MHLMLRQVEFHGIFEYQRDILSHGGRVCQVFVVAIQFGPISHIVEAHWSLNNLGVVGNDVLHRLLENEILVFL